MNVLLIPWFVTGFSMCVCWMGFFGICSSPTLVFTNLAFSELWSFYAPPSNSPCPAPSADLPMSWPKERNKKSFTRTVGSFKKEETGDFFPLMIEFHTPKWIKPPFFFPFRSPCCHGLASGTVRPWQRIFGSPWRLSWTASNNMSPKKNCQKWTLMKNL